MRPALLLSTLCACAPRAPAVALTAIELQVGGDTIISVADAVRPDYLNIPALEDALRALPTKEACAAIAAPADARFAIIKRVSFTCWAAGFASVGYALDGFGAPRELGLKRGDPGSERLMVLASSHLRALGTRVRGRSVGLVVEDDVSLLQALTVREALERAGLQVRLIPAG